MTAHPRHRRTCRLPRRIAAHVGGAVALGLAAANGASAQPSLRDEGTLAVFPSGVVPVGTRPVYNGAHAITADGRCVIGTDVITPMAPRYRAWAHPSSSSFLSAAEPFAVRTALYRNDCTPSSTYLENFSGFVSTVIAAPLVDGALVQHGSQLDLVPVPAPGGTLTATLLADAASVTPVLPPIVAAEVLRADVVLGGHNAPGDVDSLIFDAMRTWYEPGASVGTETMRQEVWVLEVRPGSAPVVRAGPFPVVGMLPLALDVPVNLTATTAPDRLVIETRRELLFMPRSGVAVDPHDVRERTDLASFRWPGGPAFGGLVPAPAGLVGLFHAASLELHRVSFDTALTDLDRDGLVVDVEAGLGTSDLDRDSDVDGFDDGVEQSLGTDPASGTSAPPALPFEPLAQLAPTSTLAMERPFGYGRVDCVLGRCWETPGLADIACVRDGALPTEVCVGTDDDTSLALGLHALPTLDGQFVVEPSDPGTSPSTITWRVRERATGTTRDITPPAGIAYLERPMALDGDEVYFTADDPASDASVSIVRWHDDGTGGTSTVVLERTACERFVGPRECGIRLVGFDRARSRPLAVVWSTDGVRVERTWLYVLETGGPRYVGELSGAVPADSTVDAIHSLATGGYVVTSRFTSGLVPGTAARLDPYFRAAGTQTRLLGGGGAPGSGRFRRGFVATDSIFTLVPPPPGMGECFEAGSITLCFPGTSGMTPMPYPVNVIFPMEWTTVGDALEPGELLVFGTDPLLTSYAQNLPRNPTLFRVTRDGAIAAWIDLARFTSLMDEPTRTALDGVALFPETLGGARTVAVSPDRSRVCLADGVRTFELHLTGGRPDLVRLAAADAGEACAYDASGALAVVGSSPHSLRVGGQAVVLPDGPRVSELVHVEDRWVVARGGEPTLCVTGDGAQAAVDETPVRAVGIAAAFGGVVWIDATSQGYLAPSVSRFCSGSPSDRLGRDGFDLWAEASATGNVPGLVTASDVAMAVRADGRTTLFPRVGEVDHAFPLVLAVSWFPRWEAIDGSGHRPLDVLRRSYGGMEAHEGLQVERLANVTAMTYVPGPAWDDDWGYRALPGSPASVEIDAGVPPVDGGSGTADAGGSMPRPPRSGSCAAVAPGVAGDGAVSALAASMLLMAARRRRGPPVRRQGKRVSIAFPAED